MHLKGPSKSERMLSGRVRSSSLENGFKCHVMRKTGAPAVTVQAWVGSGSAHEGPSLGCGLSHFLEHMLFQGTASYPGQAAAEAVHKLGGDMNAYTSHNCTVFYISLPAKELSAALDILSDMLAKPLLPKERFKLEKGVILRERDMNLDRPERIVSEKLWQTLFLSHPVRHPIIGYREKIESVDRDMAAAYHALRYSPARSFLVVVGDVDEEEAAKLAAEKFSKWPMGRLDEPSLPHEPLQSCKRELCESFPDPLSRISTGWRIPDASHPDIPALDMFCSILGGGQSSRLYKTLKTGTELAINVAAYNYSSSFEGAAGFAATCAPEKAAKLLAESLAVVERLRSEGATEAELRRNVNQQSADYLRGLRSNSGVARIIGGSVLCYGSPDFADKYILDIESLSKDDVDRVGRLYFDDAKLCVAQLVPEKGKAAPQPQRQKKQDSGEPSLKTAPGGQRIVHFEDGSLPLVDFCMILPGGLIAEPEGLAGSSKTLASLLPCGAGNLSEDALAELFDDEAADFSVISGNNTLCLRLNCRKANLDKLMAAVASVIAEPQLPEKQFERERRNFLDMLKSRKATPQSVAEDRLCETLYGAHPYSRPAGVDEESLRRLDVEAVRSFLTKSCMAPERAVVAFGGDISKHEAFERAQSLIDACKWSRAKERRRLQRPEFPTVPSRIAVKLDKQQAVVMIGMPCCDNLDPDRHALDLLHTASNSQSSKLFKSVREDQGLAYYTGMVLSSGIHEGYLAYYAGAAPENAAKVEALLAKERARLASKGLSLQEFDDAKACVLHDLSEEMQNPGRLLFNSALSEFYSLGFRSPWTRHEEISSLKFKDVNEAVSRRLSAKAQIAVLVSPLA